MLVELAVGSCQIRNTLVLHNIPCPTASRQVPPLLCHCKLEDSVSYARDAGVSFSNVQRLLHSYCNIWQNPSGICTLRMDSAGKQVQYRRYPGSEEFKAYPTLQASERCKSQQRHALDISVHSRALL